MFEQNLEAIGKIFGQQLRSLPIREEAPKTKKRENKNMLVHSFLGIPILTVLKK